MKSLVRQFAACHPVPMHILVFKALTGRYPIVCQLVPMHILLFKAPTGRLLKILF